MTGSAPAKGIWALVPAKSFHRAKARLAPVLGQDARAELAQAMLDDVLSVLKHADGLAGVLVVTGDAHVAAVAAGHGADTLADPAEQGTNAAVKRGLDHLKSLDAAHCVVVQGDIPFLSPHEFSAVLSALQRYQLVLAPAKRDGGTNILALGRPDLIVPAFGPDSFVRHLRAAASVGILPKILDLRGAGHDIDVPSDLENCPEIGTGPRTSALLGYGARPLPAFGRLFEEVLLP